MNGCCLFEKVGSFSSLWTMDSINQRSTFSPLFAASRKRNVTFCRSCSILKSFLVFSRSSLHHVNHLCVFALLFSVFWSRPWSRPWSRSRSRSCVWTFSQLGCLLFLAAPQTSFLTRKEMDFSFFSMYISDVSQRLKTFADTLKVHVHSEDLTSVNWSLVT